MANIDGLLEHLTIATIIAEAETNLVQRLVDLRELSRAKAARINALNFSAEGDKLRRVCCCREGER